MKATGWERLVTLLSGVFLLAVFCYIQFEVWRTLIGGGALESHLESRPTGAWWGGFCILRRG